jgi:hypothetical protein
MSTYLNISRLFARKDLFPWDYAGLDYPMYGSSYSYLCKYLAEYEPNQADFLKGNPSLHELERYGRENEGLAEHIYKYTMRIRDESAFSKDMHQEILDFLKDYQPFRTALTKKMESDYSRGRIVLPDGVFF